MDLNATNDTNISDLFHYENTTVLHEDIKSLATTFLVYKIGKVFTK